MIGVQEVSMTHATAVARSAGGAEGLRFDLWPLLILALAVALVLLDDRFNGRSEAASEGGTEAGEESVDGARQVRGSRRARETAGQSTPAVSDRRGSEPSTDSRGPLSPLGEQLAKIREEIVASGDPLLSWEELDREVAERRGEAV
jgi:hypothetical protein